MKPLVPAVAASFAVLLGACSAVPPPPPVAGWDPSEPNAPAPRSRYVPVTAGMADHRPVEPKSWLEQNEGVAPKPAEGM